MPRQTVLIRNLTVFAVAAFFAFTCWIIWLADTGQSSMLIALSKSVPQGDKIGHLLLFGPLTLGINAALRFRQAHLGANRMQLGSLLVISFVLLEELSQHFFPTRSVELLDLLADGAGIALFTWLSGLLDRRNLAVPSHLPVLP